MRLVRVIATTDDRKVLSPPFVGAENHKRGECSSLQKSPPRHEGTLVSQNGPDISEAVIWDNMITL